MITHPTGKLHMITHTKGQNKINVKYYTFSMPFMKTVADPCAKVREYALEVNESGYCHHYKYLLY